jgi:chemotaxis protein MotB
MAAEPHQHEDDDLSALSPPKAHKAEEGEGPWLVSYADLMTLLMGFFALMLSFSKFDDDKAEEMRRHSVELFGGEYKAPFEELKNQIQTVIQAKGLSDQVTVEANPRGIGITFRGTVFFDVGSVSPRSEAKTLLNDLMPLIRKEAPGFYILVEGHTDDTPISKEVVASNWELSALRASSIVRLFEGSEFDRSRLMAVGWSDTRPVAQNRTEQGVPISANQSANRRVVIHILKSAPLD